jgi:hypothetical protein
MTFEQQGPTGMLAIFRGGSVLDQSEPGDVKLPHLIDSIAGDRSYWKRQKCAHTGEHGGINSIGFRMFAGRLGEASRLEWIDLSQRETGLTWSPLEAMIV